MKFQNSEGSLLVPEDFLLLEREDAAVEAVLDLVFAAVVELPRDELPLLADFIIKFD